MIPGQCPACGSSVGIVVTCPSDPSCNHGVCSCGHNVASETPITREWLVEHGFERVYHDVYFHPWPGNKKTGLRVNSKSHCVVVCDSDGDYAELTKKPFTVERLSALWLVVTGGEI